LHGDRIYYGNCVDKTCFMVASDYARLLQRLVHVLDWLYMDWQWRHFSTIVNAAMLDVYTCCSSV